MRNSNIEQNDQSETIDPKVRPRFVDFAFEMQKKNLAKGGFPKRVIDQMDLYTRFERIDPNRLSRSHRWTKEDIGKTFVGYEVPENSLQGLVFEVVVTAISGRSLISFEVSEAYDLTHLLGKGWSVWHLGPFSKDSRFEIDAEKPITWEFADRACAMLDSDEVHDRFRLLMAIQDWALCCDPRYSSG